MHMKECTVADVAAQSPNALVGGPFGSDLVSRDYTPDGVPVIRGTNMGHGRWVGGEFVYVSLEKANSLAANCAKRGDLVFTQRGTLGQVALVPDAGPDRYLISQSQMKLTVDQTKADPLYLYYVFTSDEQQEYIRQNAIQTGVPHTNLGILRNTPLRLPPLLDQKAIAGILGTLDDKIELNRRMSQTLEEIARALFKSWFVDFDPVHAKAAGREPVGMDAETAALFPSEFEESELGLIPKGWQLSSLDKVATFLNGLALQKFPATDGDSFPAIKIAQLKRGNTDGADRVGTHVPETYVIRDGDMLFSWSGSLELVIWQGGTGALNQHLFKVTPNLGPTWFVYFWIDRHLPTFRDIAADKATTMGHIQRRHLAEAVVILPSTLILQRANQVLGPVFERASRAQAESKTLAELRDSLLPKLVNGEMILR